MSKLNFLFIILCLILTGMPSYSPLVVFYEIFYPLHLRLQGDETVEDKESGAATVGPIICVI